MDRSPAFRRGIRAALGLLALQGCSLQTAQNSAEREQLTAMLAQCQTEAARAAQARDEQLTTELESLREALSHLPERVSTCDAEPPRAEVVAAAVASISEPAIVEEEPQKLVVGRRENVWVEDLQLALPARIDTGAETASLDARNITPFERDGKAWVRFDIRHPKSDEMISLERRQVREALVIQASSDEPERRPVIRLGIQLGSVRQLAEFTLSDRSHLDYQMLVGRNILRDVMLVDVSAVNLVPLPAAPQSDSE